MLYLFYKYSIITQPFSTCIFECGINKVFLILYFSVFSSDLPLQLSSRSRNTNSAAQVELGYNGDVALIYWLRIKNVFSFAASSFDSGMIIEMSLNQMDSCSSVSVSDVCV